MLLPYSIALWILVALRCTPASAYDLSGTVNCSIGELEIDATAAVGDLTSLIWRDGRFIIRGIAPGDHILSIRSRRQSFHPYLVQVSDARTSTISIHHPGALADLSPPLELILQQPLVVQSLGVIDYEEPKTTFSLKRVVMSNPIVPMLLVGALMAVGLPKLLASLDPEILNEVQSNQAQLHNTFSSESIGSGLSKYLASSSAPSESPAQVLIPSIAVSAVSKSMKKRK